MNYIDILIPLFLIPFSFHLLAEGNKAIKHGKTTQKGVKITGFQAKLMGALWIVISIIILLYTIMNTMKVLM